MKPYFVDPNSGEVQDAPVGGSSTADPTWWEVDSIAILRATSALSTLPSSVPTSESVTSSAPSSGASTSVTPASACESGLSAGAGIGIGCATVGAGIAALVCLLLYKRNHRKLLQAQAAQATVGPGQEAAQYPTGSSAYAYQDASRHELEHNRSRHEML